MRTRKYVEKWNRILNEVAVGKSAKVSTFQNQILKAELPKNIQPIWPYEKERLAIALGLLEATGNFNGIVQAIEIRLRKAWDYNNGAVQLKDYFPFGLKSYAQEIHKKSLRLVSLASKEQGPVNESVHDTLLDMINYCCFAIDGDDRRK